MPVRDIDFLTSTMTVRALERTLFDRERTARLCDARSDEEVLRLLAECGYELSGALTAGGLYEALSATRTALYATLRDWLPDEAAAILDVFRIQADYHNVKVLIKTDGEKDQRLLLNIGRVPAGEMAEIAREAAFSRLPGALGDAARSARETLARTDDPQLSDFLLDRACLREMLAAADASQSVYLLGYVKIYIDSYNLRSLVRATRIGKGPDFLRLVLAPGGSVEPSRIAAALQGGGSLEELFAGGPLAAAAAAGVPAAKGEGSLTAFEKQCDDALMQYARKARAVPFGEAPLIGYLLEKEAEMTMLRTVVGGRLGGVPVHQIRERLRAAYV
ncbi:MAG: V-type ATPase subunit [Oscillospiraceae bacterium]|jgi:V/A-type H+-transporting ATPase subunit C|nr:V-type ATPase subunit [Oscillospiraceae bacterium]